jgi:hypothetical protein
VLEILASGAKDFFILFTRVNFYYHFFSYSILNNVTYLKVTLIFSSQVSIAKIPMPILSHFDQPPFSNLRCLETVLGLSTYCLLELSRTFTTENLACHGMTRFMPVTVRSQKSINTPL